MHRVHARRQAWRAVAFVMLAAVLRPASAQELSLLAGNTHEQDGNHETYAWDLEYLQGLGEHAAVSISWLNEGHVPGHHRDGHAVQLWARTSVFDRRLWLSAGVGPYRYFDTVPAAHGASYNDSHDWGAIFSLGSAWYTGRRWVLNLRLNRIETQSDFDSNLVLLGVG